MKHLPLFVLFAAFAAGCASTIETTATKRQAEIKIDGDARDWSDLLTPTKQANTQLGIQYDDEFLYLCLEVGDRQNQTQMIVGGFTVWFDPEGGTSKKFGIRCPVGRQEDARVMRQLEGPEAFQAFLAQAQQDVQIESEGSEPLHISKVEAKGIELQLSRGKTGFMYELKVPLQRSSDRPYAVGMASGKSLGIGFESYEIVAMRGAGGGGGGGGRGSGPLGGRVPTTSAGGERPKLINFWAHTTMQ